MSPDLSDRYAFYVYESSTDSACRKIIKSYFGRSILQRTYSRVAIHFQRKEQLPLWTAVLWLTFMTTSAPATFESDGCLPMLYFYTDRQLLLIKCCVILLFNDRRWLRNIASEDVTFNEIRQPDLRTLLAFETISTCNHTFDSYAMNSFVGTEKTWSISSSVNCLVSRTKQKIINHAARFKPA